MKKEICFYQFQIKYSTYKLLQKKKTFFNLIDFNSVADIDEIEPELLKICLKIKEKDSKSSYILMDSFSLQKISFMDKLLNKTIAVRFKFERKFSTPSLLEKFDRIEKLLLNEIPKENKKPQLTLIHGDKK